MSLDQQRQPTTVTEPPDRKILTVSELTREIKSLIETGFDHVWVKGEISNFRVPASGHFYFTLKDETANLTCVMFRLQNKNIQFQPKDGMEILVGGKLSVYEARGNYQIICHFMEPLGFGALQLKFEQLKEKLSQEGLFDPGQKKSLPFLPQKISIITSPTGAAIRDILNILTRRFPNLEILIIPTAVQGEKGAPEIVRAFGIVAELGEADVIILARGGGSLEDLWPFNEEIVARAIAASTIPVISAVGHEIDFTIADFVADLRAPTPSAAAELVVQNKSDLQRLVRDLRSRSVQALQKSVQIRRVNLKQLAQRIIDPRTKLIHQRLRLDDMQGRLLFIMKQFIQNTQTRVKYAEVKLPFLIKLKLKTVKEQLERGKALLESLNPLAILQRGYSIARKAVTGEIIKNTSHVNVGEKISLQLAEGDLLLTVDSVSGARE